jgi:TM2 domain-containing membrane protein YozV
MERKYISVMLSGLVFPGAGQLYNNQRVKGIIYILLTVGCLIGLVCAVVGGFLRVLQYQGPREGTAWDVIMQGLGGYREAIVVLVLILGVTWAAGIADAYLTARKRDTRQVQRFIARKR